MSGTTISCAFAEPSVLSEHCYVSKIQDKKVGFACITQTKENNEITTIKHIEQNFNRFGSELKKIKDYKYVETIDGSPVMAEATISSPGENIRTTATFSSDKITVNKNVSGSITRQEIALSNSVLFPYAIQMQVLNNFSKNQFSYYTIDPNTDFRLIKVIYKKDRDSSASTYNNDVLSPFKVSIDLMPNLSNNEWYNSKGILIKKYFSLFNIQETLVAKKQIDICENNDNIFLKNLIPVDTYIKNQNDIQQITFKIDTGADNSSDLFVSDDRQRIIQSFNDLVFLKILAEKSSKDKFKYPVNSKGMGKYLVSGPYIKIHSPQIHDAAKELTSKNNDSYLIAKDMEKWVGGYLSQNDISTNISDTDTILRHKNGNSLEYSVLLASLLRSANIPSKIVVGLVYTQTPESSFSYHVWVKAYIGKWINLDAYYPSDSFSPLHIALKETDLAKVEDKDILIGKLVKIISCYKISILNYNTNEKPVNNIKLTESNTSNENINTVNLASNEQNRSQISQINLENKNTSSDQGVKDVKLSNYNHDELVRIGFYNFAEGNIDQAVENFQKANDITPISNNFTDIQLAKRLTSLGLFELAQKNLSTIYDTALWGQQVNNIKSTYFPQIMPVGDNQNAYAKALSAINYQNKPDIAIAIILKNPDISLSVSDYANYILAKAYLSKSELNKAERCINRALSVNNRNIIYKEEKVNILLAQKRYKEGLSLISEIQSTKNIDQSIFSNLESQKYIALSELQTKKQFKDYYLAKSYYIDGEYEKSANILSSLLGKNVKNNSIHSLSGLVYLAQSETKLARTQFEKALALNKSDYEAYMGLGDIELNASNYIKALEYYKSADKYSETKEISSYKVGLANAMLGNVQKALEFYQKSNIGGNNYLAYYGIGQIYAETDKTQDAVKNLKKAVSINPLYYPVWIELSKLALKQNNAFLAVEYLVPVKYINPESADYYYVSGLISLSDDNKTIAKKQFQKALTINPNYNEAQSELSKLELVE
jgi:tetratricopeptide (TPR) repeat protein